MMDVYLGLGANIGDRWANLKLALKLLGERIDITHVSSVYETEPVGFEEQPPFLNAVCIAQTDIEPCQMLSLIKGIEVSMGRKAGFRNAPRPIDIDILLYGDLVLHDPELTIPHPRMAERAFVLLPLVEVAPDVVHPFMKESIRDLAAKVGATEGVKRLEKMEATDV